MLTVNAYPIAQKYLKGKEQKDKDEGGEQYGQASNSPGTLTRNIARCEEAERDTNKRGTQTERIPKDQVP